MSLAQDYMNYRRVLEQLKNKVAIRFQSIVRGHQVRTQIQHTRRAALIIQKCWRGKLGARQLRVPGVLDIQNPYPVELQKDYQRSVCFRWCQ